MSFLHATGLYRWWLNRWRRSFVRPTVGAVDFGDLRTLVPLSREFGYDRGLPVDRYYIEQFLARHRKDIRGCVLEIGDNVYTRKYGGDSVSQSDVLSLTADGRTVTLVGDLATSDDIPRTRFDCIIFTQTLQFIFDHRAALETLYNSLKPRGVLLATLPGITKIPQDRWGPLCCWSYTEVSARTLLEQTFATGPVEVESCGNVLAACAFLHGLATEELAQEELDYRDPLFPVLISARAQKAA